MAGNQLFSPLLERGWCFQENLLSSRILHYTSTELVWQCRVYNRCECGVLGNDFFFSPAGPSNDADEGKTQEAIFPTMRSIFKNALKDECRENKHYVWRDLITNYSQLLLTREQDRLPALSGIAFKFSKALGEGYLTGLRTALASNQTDRNLNSFSLGLLWISIPCPGHRTEACIAPSFSRASRIGPIIYIEHNDMKHTMDLPIESTRDCISVVDVEMSADPSVPFGASCIAVSLRCKLVAASVTIAGSDGKNIKVLFGEKSRYIVNLDGTEDTITAGQKPIFCMPVISFRRQQPPDGDAFVDNSLEVICIQVVNALVLAEIAPDIYRRIGLVTWIPEKYFEATKEQLIIFI